MHTQKFLPSWSRFVLLAALLALPLSATAQSPSAVTGIRAWEENGRVHVSWQALPESEGVAYYRIFFATKSIIDNNGLYDDFDIADGTVSEHVLATIPQAPILFFSVLAVNDRGEESPYFAEEAKLERGEDNAQMTSAATSNPFDKLRINQTTNNPQPTGESLTLLSAEAVSSTGVLVTFSLPVTVDTEEAQTAFTILDGSGQTLVITRLVIIGNAVTLHTLPQDPMKVYQLHIQSIEGRQIDGLVAALEGGKASILFSGFSDNRTTVRETPLPGSTLPEAPRDARVLNLRAEATGNGRFVVTAAWEPDGDDGNIAQWRIAHTTDHGRTFSAQQNLPVAPRSVRIGDVPAGEFGLRVQAVSAQGVASPGTLSFIQLGTATVPAPIEQVTPISGVPLGAGQTHLPQSGMGLIGVIALLGAAGGTAWMRQRRAELRGIRAT